MAETIELAIDTPDGIADCRLEPNETDGGIVYSATILYPNVVNGFSRSEIYCHDMVWHEDQQTYAFNTAEEIHPKVLKLEGQLAAAVSG